MQNKIKVENRSGKYLVDSIPNTNIKFTWVKQGSFVFLTEGEIKELYYKPGGKLFFQNLIIHDQKLREELIGEVEPEYYYTQKEIDEILLNGSIDQLRDALDFSPKGGVDLIVNRAIKLKIPDHNKRMVITEFTGHDINSSILFDDVEDEKDNKIEQDNKHKRRANPINTKPVIKLTSDD